MRRMIPPLFAEIGEMTPMFGLAGTVVI
jgi:hypothetical protein